MPVYLAPSKLRNHRDPTKSRRNRAFPPPPPNTSFDNFPDLPPELRRMVYEYAFPGLPGPRVIEVACIYQDQSTLHRYVFRTNTMMPALFYVCKDSRDWILKKYKAPQYKAAFGHSRALEKIFFDFERDVLWLNMEANAAWDFVTNLKNQGDLAQVQNLALNYFPFLADVHTLSQNIDPILIATFRFTGLKNIALPDPIPSSCRCRFCSQLPQNRDHSMTDLYRLAEDYGEDLLEILHTQSPLTFKFPKLIVFDTPARLERWQALCTAELECLDLDNELSSFAFEELEEPMVYY